MNKIKKTLSFQSYVAAALHKVENGPNRWKSLWPCFNKKLMRT